MPEKTIFTFKDIVKEFAYPIIGIGCFFSFQAGVYVAAKANANRNGSYTHRKEVLAFPIREVITTEQLIQNGDTLVRVNKSYVRFVPDSIAMNIQP